jgi:hypothetical protein
MPSVVGRAERSPSDQHSHVWLVRRDGFAPAQVNGKWKIPNKLLHWHDH